MTVGTGIGGSCVLNKVIAKGLLHSELGHMFVPQPADDQEFDGVCPYHGNCLEGLASGPALEKRWGKHPEDLADEHRAWDLEADYLAHALANIITIVMPERIIIGGGVMNHTGLLERVAQRVPAVLANYIAIDQLKAIDRYIVKPGLGERSAVLGALHMAAHS